MKFALIDAANLFNRAHHVCHGDAFTKAGMALHIIFNSLDKVFRINGCDHLVLCAEGRSWRYDYYPPYKAKRKIMRETLSPKDHEEQEVFYDVLKDFIDFMAEKTRCTVLHTQGAEADDLIARFIQLHPSDEHVIISGDSDMVQLIAPNVSIYNGVTQHLITCDGVFDEKQRELVFSVKPGDGKLKIGEPIVEASKTKLKKDREQIKIAQKEEGRLSDEAKAMKIAYDKSPPGTVEQVAAKSAWEKADRELAKSKIAVMAAKAEAEKPFEFSKADNWSTLALFIKCIRGDVGDGVFSAYPGVRYQGSAKRVGIEDAWMDREAKGFHWNNFMLQSWDRLDEDGGTTSVKVLDEYMRNVMLIDLSQQPEEIVDLLDRVIVDAIQKEPVGNVGMHFLRFCAKHELTRIGERAQDHVRYLNASYFGKK